MTAACVLGVKMNVYLDKGIYTACTREWYSGNSPPPPTPMEKIFKLLKRGKSNCVCGARYTSYKTIYTYIRQPKERLFLVIFSWLKSNKSCFVYSLCLSMRHVYINTGGCTWMKWLLNLFQRLYIWFLLHLMI